MVAMSRPPAAVLLTPEEQTTLELWSRPGRTEPRLRQRARIILRASEGHATEDIAKEFQTRPSRVSKWRGRFAKERLAGLRDKPRPGRPEPLRYPKDTGGGSWPSSTGRRRRALGAGRAPCWPNAWAT